MEIKAKTVILEMEGGEVYNLAWEIKHSLQSSIREHWNNLQQEKDGEELFFENEKKMIKMMKDMFEVSGYGYCYEGVIREFEMLFEKKRKERELGREIKIKKE